MTAHPGRTLGVVCGVALGAAVFGSVRLAIHTSVAAFSRSADLIAGSADGVVVNPGGFVPETWVSQLIKREEVTAAAPFLRAYVEEEGGSGAPFLLIGVDPFLEAPFRSWTGGTVREDVWAMVRDPFNVLLGRRLAREMGLEPGGKLCLTLAHRRGCFRVAGILEAAELSLVDGGRVAVTDIASLQEFADRGGVVDRIDLRLKRPGDAQSIESIEAFLPPSLRFSPPGTGKSAMQGLLDAYGLNLSVLSFVALFVGMFLVFSLVSMNAVARRKELAVLRSLGATERWTSALFLTEGVMLGILGWIAAVPLTALGTKALLHGITRSVSTLFVRVSVEELHLSGWEMGLSFVLTVGVCVAAAVQPAWRIRRVSAKEALAVGLPWRMEKESTARAAVLGLLLMGLVFPLCVLPPVAGVPLAGYAATFFLFAGFALVSPAALKWAGRRGASLLRRGFGEPAHLAARSVERTPLRSAVSVGALIAAVALFVALLVMVGSFRSTVNLWVEQTVSGDLFVLPRLGQVNRHRNLFPPEAVKVFKSLRLRADLLPYRRFHLFHASVPYQLEIIDMAVFFRHGRFLWVDGDETSARKALLQGKGCVVSEVFANKTGLKVGDRFRAQVTGVTLDLPILGVIRDYRARGGVVFYSLPHYQALGRRAEGAAPKDRWSGLRLFVRNQGPPSEKEMEVEALRRRIIQALGDTVTVTEGKVLRSTILRIFDETFGVTFAMLFIALVVAALGIATTLSISILERTVEHATLLALGAHPRQMRSMIFWEASFLVLVGEIAGIVCGLALSVILVFVVNRQSFGWTFLYRIDWGWLLGAVPLIFLTALAAALPTVRLIFRIPPAVVLRDA